MSISSEIQALNTSRQNIAAAITQKGGTVSENDGFSQFATAITNLPSGGGDDSTLRDLIEGDITSITIPSATTRIKAVAFQKCTSLTSISIPNTVTSIGDRAFYECSALQSINIPSSVTTLGTQCFGYCSNLTSITIPDSVTTIPSYLVDGCSNLTKIIVGNNVSTIEIGAFSTSNNNLVLSAIVINTTTVPNLKSTDAFNYTHECPIYVPAESVAAYKAGYRWSDLSSRIFAIQQVATVDGNPVYNYDLGVTDVSTLTDLQVAALPSGDVLEFAEGVTSMQGQIGGYEEVILPSTFTSFSDTQPINAATTTLTSKATTPPGVERNNLGGSGLTAIYVPYGYGATYQSAAAWSTFSSIIQELPAPPKAVLTLSNSTTVNVPGDGTTKLLESDVTAVATITDIVSAVVNEGITALNRGLNSGAFSGATNLSSVTLPSTLTQISGKAFRNTALASIYIPENVESITPVAFENCPLTSITVDANNTTYSSRNNCNAVIETTNEILVLGCQSTVIDTDVKTIGAYSFKGRTSLTDISLPDSVTLIETSAFSGCTSLETVAIGEGIEEMGVSVFSGCDNLTDITILADAAPDVSGEDPFDGCNASITMHVPAASVEAYQAWLNDDLGTAADITVVAISE